MNIEEVIMLGVYTLFCIGIGIMIGKWMWFRDEDY